MSSPHLYSGRGIRGVQTILQPLSTPIPIDIYELLFYNGILSQPISTLLQQLARKVVVTMATMATFTAACHKWHKKIYAIAEIAANCAIPVTHRNNPFNF
jgi:hypothetical protein